MEMANPLLKSFGEPPKGLCDKFQPSPGETQRKRKPRSAIGLFKFLLSYVHTYEIPTQCPLTDYYIFIRQHAIFMSMNLNTIVNVQTMRKISQIFVCLSESLNLTGPPP